MRDRYGNTIEIGQEVEVRSFRDGLEETGNFAGRVTELDEPNQRVKVENHIGNSIVTPVEQVGL